MQQLRSIEFTAQQMGISPYTVRAWIGDGLLGSVKLGRRRLVPESEISRVISEGTIPARKPLHTGSEASCRGTEEG